MDLGGRIDWRRVSAERLDGYFGKIAIVRMELETAPSGVMLAGLVWLLPGIAMRPDARFSLCTAAQEAAESALLVWLGDAGLLDG